MPYFVHARRQGHLRHGAACAQRARTARCHRAAARDALCRRELQPLAVLRVGRLLVCVQVRLGCVHGGGGERMCARCMHVNDVRTVRVRGHTVRARFDASALYLLRPPLTSAPNRLVPRPRCGWRGLRHGRCYGGGLLPCEELLVHVVGCVTASTRLLRKCTACIIALAHPPPTRCRRERLHPPGQGIKVRHLRAVRRAHRQCDGVGDAALRGALPSHHAQVRGLRRDVTVW